MKYRSKYKNEYELVTLVNIDAQLGKTPKVRNFNILVNKFKLSWGIYKTELILTNFKQSK